jgi:hypothetical protein
VARGNQRVQGLAWRQGQLPSNVLVPVVAGDVRPLAPVSIVAAGPTAF